MDVIIKQNSYHFNKVSKYDNTKGTAIYALSVYDSALIIYLFVSGTKPG